MKCVAMTKISVTGEQMTTGNAIQDILFTITESKEKKYSVWDKVNTTTAGIALIDVNSLLIWIQSVSVYG